MYIIIKAAAKRLGLRVEVELELDDADAYTYTSYSLSPTPWSPIGSLRTVVKGETSRPTLSIFLKIGDHYSRA